MKGAKDLEQQNDSSNNNVIVFNWAIFDPRTFKLKKFTSCYVF